MPPVFEAFLIKLDCIIPMYHIKDKKNRLEKKKSLPRDIRWKLTYYPSGYYSAGRIPNAPSEKYSEASLEYEYKVLREIEVSEKGDIVGEKRIPYWKRKKDGYILGSAKPSLSKIQEMQECANLSSEATPEGLTDLHNSATYQAEREGEEEVASSFGLSPVSISRTHSMRSRKGSKGISRKGRLQVREGCSVLAAKFSNKNLGFYTLTLPHSGEELEKIVSNWSKLVHRYFEELGREYKRRGVDLYYVSVTEIQEKRYWRSGECAPHLHYVANSKSGKSFILTPSEVRGIFARVCSRIVESDKSFESAENCQVVRKDAGRYLSKYFSKGGSCLQNIIEEGIYCLPCSWYKLSPSAKNLIKAHTQIFFDEECWLFLEICKERSRDAEGGYRIEAIYKPYLEYGDCLFGYWGYCPRELRV